MMRKMDFWTIEISAKFKDIKQVMKLQKDLIDKFYYECNKHKDYMAQVIIGISNVNSKYVIGVYNEQKGKSGRPRKIKDLLEENDFNKRMFGDLKKDWHIHLLALTTPSETLARVIKDYLDKNKNVGITYKKFVDNDKNDIDIDMLFYIAKQSDNILFYGSGDKRFKYTFRQIYEEKVKQYTNIKFNKKYLKDENYRNKLDSKLINMINYFNTFYDEEKKKRKENKYMKQVKIRKIAERYKIMEERDNKVLKNKSIINNKK